MFSRKTIKKRFGGGCGSALSTAFAYQVSAYSVGDNTSYTYTGKVVEVDNAHRYVTVQAGRVIHPALNWDDHATVTKCDKIVSLSDLKPGDMVTIYYFQENLGGRHIASEIGDDGIRMKRC